VLRIAYCPVTKCMSSFGSIDVMAGLLLNSFVWRWCNVGSWSWPALPRFIKLLAGLADALKIAASLF
jgi:hypothetical protein